MWMWRTVTWSSDCIQSSQDLLTYPHNETANFHTHVTPVPIQCILALQIHLSVKSILEIKINCSWTGVNNLSKIIRNVSNKQEDCSFQIPLQVWQARSLSTSFLACIAVVISTLNSSRVSISLSLDCKLQDRKQGCFRFAHGSPSAHTQKL